MRIRLTFLGAAQNVTGSRYLVEANGSRVLVECGLYQERQFRDRNWEAFPFPPGDIDAVLLTHAHLDHCGLLPKLVRDGFRGKVYCTPARSERLRARSCRCIPSRTPRGARRTSRTCRTAGRRKWPRA